jgi:hypothetical protein
MNSGIQRKFCGQTLKLQKAALLLFFMGGNIQKIKKLLLTINKISAKL